MKIYSGECEYGKCGLVTDMVDSVGAALFIGDIVVIASKVSSGISCFWGLSVVVEDRPDLVSRAEYKKPFIMGIADVDINTDDEWYVKKIKHWEDCVNGEHMKEFGLNYREAL